MGKKKIAHEIGLFENTILLFVVHPKLYISIVFNFPWDLQLPQEKFNTMFMQNFRETTKSIIVFTKTPVEDTW